FTPLYSSGYNRTRALAATSWQPCRIGSMQEPTKGEVAALTTCSVQPGGEFVELGYLDAGGRHAALRLSFEDAQAVSMTLPKLLSRALQEKLGKPEVRYVYPLGSWRIEASPGENCAITTFATDDGYEVSFQMSFRACRALGWALQEESNCQQDRTVHNSAKVDQLN